MLITGLKIHQGFDKRKYWRLKSNAETDQNIMRIPKNTLMYSPCTFWYRRNENSVANRITKEVFLFPVV